MKRIFVTGCLTVMFIFLLLTRTGLPLMQSEKDIKKRDVERKQYIEEVKKYSDNRILEEVVKKETPSLKKEILIREIGNRVIEKGRSILEKFIQDGVNASIKERNDIERGKGDPFRPPIEITCGGEAKISLILIDFKSSGKSDKEYIPFLVSTLASTISKGEPPYGGGAIALLRESVPQYYDEISNHLLANKENDELCIELLLALAESKTDRIQYKIIEYMDWCKKNKRIEKTLGRAQMAIGMIGNKEVLAIFKDDLQNTNPRVRAGAVYGISKLMSRKIISIEEANGAVEFIKDDKNEDVQRAYNNLQMEIKDIKILKEEENRKSQQEDKTEPKDSPDKSGQDDTDHSGDKPSGQDKK